MEEIAGVNIIVRAVAEYGILGLGWVLFLFAMLYIRTERSRYQDLVIHIITYFTKIHMLKGQQEDVMVDFTAELLGGSKPSGLRGARSRRASDSKDHER